MDSRMKLYNVVEAVHEQQYRPVWDKTQPDSTWNFWYHIHGEPFLNLLQRYGRRISTEVYQRHFRTSKRSFRTAVKTHESIFDGFRILQRIASGDYVPSRRIGPTGNWKPYFRATQRGIRCDTNGEDILYQDIPFDPAPDPFDLDQTLINQCRVPLARHGGVNFLSYTGLALFAQDVLDTAGTTFFLSTTDTKGRKQEFWFSMLAVDDLSISYHVEIKAWQYLKYGKRGYRYDLNVLIERGDKNFSEGFVTTIAGLEQYQKVGSEFDGSWNNTNIKTVYLNVTTPTEEIIESPPTFYERSNVSIVRGTPLLFQTQSQAFGKAFGDISRNFESLMELPGTILLINDIIRWPTAYTKRFGRISGILSRASFLLKVIMGAWLAFIFALRPAYASLIDVLSVITDISDQKYEASWSDEGDSDSFMQLPYGLRKYMCGDFLEFEDVRHYKITFHTEVSIIVDQAFISRVLGSIADYAIMIGIAPEPKIIWALLPFSFIVDWFIPISRLIENAQNFFGTFSSKIGTIGHSVFIEVENLDGTIFNVYIRSDNSRRPLDPSPDYWDVAGGVYEAAAVPLVILGALGKA